MSYAVLQMFMGTFLYDHWHTIQSQHRRLLQYTSTRKTNKRELLVMRGLWDMCVKSAVVPLIFGPWLLAITSLIKLA